MGGGVREWVSIRPSLSDCTVHGAQSVGLPDWGQGVEVGHTGQDMNGELLVGGGTLWTEGRKAFTENFPSDEGATGALQSSQKQCHLS